MAVTVDQKIVVKDNSNANILTYQIANTEKPIKGAIAAVTAGGYLASVAAGNKATNVLAVIPLETKTASANGVISSTGEADANCVQGYISGIFQITTSGLTIADLGSKLYVTDNYTFTTTSVDNTLVGTIVQFISATTVYVDLNK
jgi:hypothetical protein